MKSLRKRLAAALLLTMTLAWFAAFALQHRMVTDEQTGQWDQSLRDAAVQAMTLAPDSLLERAPGAGLAVATTPEEDADQTRVQVWSLADRRLLQRTPDTPDAPFVADFKPGYATSDSGGQTWRVYALNDASGRVQVQAAKSTQALRENYVHRLTRGLIFATLMFLLLVAAALGVMRRAFAGGPRGRHDPATPAAGSDIGAAGGHAGRAAAVHRFDQPAARTPARDGRARA